jgi:hypothetical protein
MTTHLKLLAQRRQQLITRCALQREALGIQRIRLTQSLNTADRVIALLDRLRRNPAVILALAGGLFLVKPRRLLSLMRSGLLVARGWKVAAPLLATLLATRKHR